MAFSAVVAIGAMMAGQSMAKKGDSPQLAIEQPPAAASTDPKAADAQSAADQQRKRAAAAGGRADTVKTGPQGLGSMPSNNAETKTLLGY